jgi:imidazolonepropionase-like amidohydrolase/Tol biopolymer transport system component
MIRKAVLSSPGIMSVRTISGLVAVMRFRFVLRGLLAAAFIAAQLFAQSKDFKVHQDGDRLPLQPARLLEWTEQEGTWVSLDISPDGTSIVFELLGDLYTMPAAGGEAHCIVCGLPFDSQPVYSPNGREIVFVSDRDGNENLWVADADGSHPRQISQMEDNSVFVSPEWARDGKSIYISRYKPDMNAYELWRYVADGANHEPVEQVTHARRTPDTPKPERDNALGAAVSPDGRYLYYEDKTGLGFDDDITLPLWHIVRRDLTTGEERTVITAQGSAFRPRLTPDGKQILYAERRFGKTSLRIRNLETGEDRLLVAAIQRDDQEGLSSRDLIPRYAITPDSKAVIANYGGKLHRIDLATGAASEIPFTAHIALPVGPYMRPELHEETGPVRARLVQHPSQSPDGTRIAFSALARLYIADSKIGSATQLTHNQDAFEPAWSRDGQWITYVTWSAGSGGELWRIRADGSGTPEKLSAHSDYYAFPEFAPDGKSIFVLRSNEYYQLHKLMDFPPYQADLIQISLEGAGRQQRVIASGLMRSGAQFTAEPGVVYVNLFDGLYRVPLDGGKPKRVLQVTGPTWYFVDGTANADLIKISPDGRWALAQITQQLYLIPLPAAQPEGGYSVDLTAQAPKAVRITSVGADFFNWDDNGKTITWALGATFFREPLAAVQNGSSDPPSGQDLSRAAVQHLAIHIEVPRDIPHGTLVLRNAAAITMRRDAPGEVIRNADIVITDNHIAAIGPRGSVAIPPGAELRDLSGHYVVPGFIDVHMHWGSIRRNILDTESWAFRAALAYGITASLDPSSLSIDTFAYEDMIDAGLMTGSRIYTTGPALFSFNNIRTPEQALNNIRRNPEFYRTRNLKEYRTGNRMQRELVAQASHTLDLLTTTEGALDMKLDMTQIQDGFSGNEHAYTAVPIADDIVQLFTRTGVSYTPTLQISNGGMEGQNWFYLHRSPFADPNQEAKLRHFVPAELLERKMERVHAGQDAEYSFPLVAEGAARIQRAGGLVAVGSHGELPGLGYHYELQALAMGGMKPLEVLRAATIDSAKTIGRDSELGSLEAGKYADLMILKRNPLEDIRNTLSIESVMKNGRLYDGETLNEQWPRRKAEPVLWFQRETRAADR